MSVVYALVCPHTEVVRYIGLTGGNPKTRLAAHIREAKAGAKLYSSNWIRSLGDAKPRLMILEECEDVNRAEQVWIAWGKHVGLKLTNTTAGGEGVVLDEGAKRWRRIAKIKQEYLDGKDAFELHQIDGHSPEDVGIAIGLAKAERMKFDYEINPDDADAPEWMLALSDAER